MKSNRIEILGCSASGKTTLCRTLSELGYGAVYEPYGQNPFLRSFFAGTPCGFELQICFLLQHYNAIRESKAPGLTVCDFSFALDSVYASILLSEQEQEIHKQLREYLISQIGSPRYLIKLLCSDALVAEHMRIRNRDYESYVDMDFLRALNAGVAGFVPKASCIEIDVSKVDVSDTEAVKKYLQLL